jgi:hypothetical protein
MFVVTKSKSEKEVGKALEILIESINRDLEKIGGLISGLDCEINVDPLKASVSVSVFLDGYEPRHKLLIGVNEKGYNRENSMKKAQKKVNQHVEGKNGKIAGTYVKTIGSLPGRVYTTIILIHKQGVEALKKALSFLETTLQL